MLRSDHLHRDDSIQRRVQRFEHRAHSTAADKFLEMEVAEQLPLQCEGQFPRREALRKLIRLERSRRPDDGQIVGMVDG